MNDCKREELLLSIKKLNLSYEKPVLRNIDLEIRDIKRTGMTQGQIVSICGRSGAGKSSLFNLLAGYKRPTSGEILIGVDQHPVRKGEMGVVPQDYTLFSHRTIHDNLLLALWNSSGVDKKETINEYADYFQIKECLQKYPSELSGGQRQRVSILQQVLGGNKFILLDEPFSGLDVIMKDKVIEILLKVANLDELNTLVIVSHDIESSCAISDTVFVLGSSPEGGSTIVKTYDLIEEDLAYHSEIKDMPRFRQIINEIKMLM